jgi:hypothetical protein
MSKLSYPHDLTGYGRNLPARVLPCSLWPILKRAENGRSFMVMLRPNRFSPMFLVLSLTSGNQEHGRVADSGVFRTASRRKAADAARGTNTLDRILRNSHRKSECARQRGLTGRMG